MSTGSQFAPSPSAELIAFAQRQVQNARIILGVQNPRKEKRAQQRTFVVEPVLVQRVDEKFQAVGEPLTAVTRDISTQGIGLIMETSTAHDLLALQFSVDGRQRCVVVKVIWRKPMGPFDYLGAQCVKELSELPQEWPSAIG